MFKKSLLALGVIAVSASAAAATATKIGPSTAYTISHEGLAVSSTTGAVTETVDLSHANNLVVDLGDAKTSGYSSLKDMIIDISGASISPSSDLVVQFTPAQADTSVSAVVSYPSDTQIKLAITNTGYAWTSAAGVSIGGLILTPDSNAVGSTISATYTAISSVGNSAIETATGVLTKVVNEFKATISDKIDAKIDVNSDRNDFVSVSADTLEINVEDVATTFEDVSAQKVTAVINHDFSWTDGSDADALPDTGLVSGDFTVATTLDKATITAYDTISGSSVQKSLTITPDSKLTIPASSFTADVSVGTTADADKYYTVSLAGGSWTLNGATAELPFVPFGSAYAHSITVANESAIAGEITVELIANGEKVTEVLSTVAAAKSVTQIGKEVAALAAANNMTAAQVNVIVNAPETLVNVTGLYYSKADADRVLIK